MEEKDVIKGLRDRDPKALQAMHDKYRLQLYLYINGKFNFLHEEIVDLITETFEHTFQAKPVFESFTHMGAYLYATAFNKSCTLAKKHKLHQQHEKGISHTIEKQQKTAHELRQEEYTIKRIKACIKELPARNREVMRLTYQEKLSDKEIAKRLNTSINNVQQIRSRSIKIIQKKLGKRLLDDPDAFTTLIILLLFSSLNA